jgi:hypothetical protein
MGRQVNFYLHGEDHNEFDALLRSCGGPVILPFYYPEKHVSAVPDTLMRDKEKEGKRVYLVRPVDFPQMQLRYHEYYGNWNLDENALPVLQYDRCVNTEHEIYRGRLYFQPHYLKNGEWAFHSAEFVKWANNFINKARRKLKKQTFDSGGYNYQEYVGKSAASWIEKNKPEPKGGGTLIYSTSHTATDK